MKSNVTRRLYIGFSTAILLVCAVGISSYLTYKKQAEEQRWVQQTNAVISQIQDIKITLIEMRTGIRSYLLTNEPVFLTNYKKGSAQIFPQLEDLRRMFADNKNQLDYLDILKINISGLVDYWERLLDTGRIHNSQELLTMTKIEESTITPITRIFATMTARESKQLDARAANYVSLLNNAVNVLIFGIFLILFIVITLNYFILREFTNRKKAEEALKNNLEELDELNKVNSQRNWLLTGVTEVNKVLQGDTNVTLLSEDILRSILKYLELPAGVFYITTDNNRQLQIIASVAAPVVNGKKILLSHSLASNAGRSREITLVKNIPSDFWSIESPLGNTLPGEIAYIPLLLHGVLKGMIELATFNSFTNEQVNLLHVVADNIVVSLNSAQSREEVEALLKQLQHQKDELINQQEELHKANEELSRQTEILQQSEEELREREQELRQTNEELLERNEAVELARQSLLLQANELEDANKYKSEFLANMSHELRTPLNSILILAKQLSENRYSNLTDKQVEHAGIIYNSGSDLLELINDMLDLSKIESGKIELYVEDVSVKQIEEDVQQLFDVVAKEKSIRFITSIHSSVPSYIRTDKQRLEQIIKNLLSNAFKFTGKNGEIRMDISLQKPASDTMVHSDLNRVIAIEVIDNGIGIAPDKQQLIFEAFQQADGATNRKYGGTGLGLSICKELAYILGGEIRLKSEVGSGSNFTIYIPIALKMDRQVINRKKEVQNFSNKPETKTPQSKITDDRSNIFHNDKVVLIIEDDVQFALILRDFAREKKYKTIVVLQGDEGLLYARKYKPNAIILDINLPVISGWTLLKLFKEDEMLKNIPVHIISGSDFIEHDSGNIISYLKKPVDRQELESTFEAMGVSTDAQFKKLLIHSGAFLNNDTLGRLFDKRKFDLDCTYVSDFDEMLQQLQNNSFDGIITDAGSDLQKAKNNLQQLKLAIADKAVPVITYIDADISLPDELELMNLSDVVIRDALMSKDRLMDELDLFLYKVQETQKKQPELVTYTDKVTDDNLLKGKKVLLVDDDMRNVFVLSGVLEDRDMKVIAAGNGKEALEELKKHPDINIILTDIMMPEMDGYETIGKIRNELHFDKLPVIALTAKAMLDDREKCIKAGASDYITKPVDVNKLISLMRIWLAQ